MVGKIPIFFLQDSGDEGKADSKSLMTLMLAKKMMNHLPRTTQNDERDVVVIISSGPQTNLIKE